VCDEEGIRSAAVAVKLSCHLTALSQMLRELACWCDGEDDGSFLMSAACSNGRDLYEAVLKKTPAFVDVLRQYKSCRCGCADLLVFSYFFNFEC
jgi:hypothetical protein